MGEMKIETQHFIETKELADGIEGMLSPFSMAVIDSLLALQGRRGVVGDVMEFGVFRGKSAAVLGRRMARNETLRLYDIADYFDKGRLERSGARIAYTVKDTMKISRSSLRQLKRAARFCHVDAGHTFKATTHEMSLADHVLAEDGILCLDDYTNLNYSQIIAATFSYLFTRHTSLRIFLVTEEKAYLCRKSAFPTYERFVLDELREQMTTRGISDTCLARTDSSRDYKAIHLRIKAPGEADDLYGRSIYGHFYEIEQPLTLVERARKLARVVLRR
jgi:hypothetical protein